MKKTMVKMSVLLVMCLLLCSMACPAAAFGGCVTFHREDTCWQVDLDEFSGQVSALFPGPQGQAPRFQLTGPAQGAVQFWAVYHDENGAPTSPQKAASMQLVLHCTRPTSGRMQVQWGPKK